MSPDKVIVNALMEEIEEKLDVDKSNVKDVSIDTKKKTITITLDYHEVPEDNYIGLKPY